MYSPNKLIRTISLVGAIVLVTFAWSPGVRAVSPPPDGGYPNGNTAEGTDALFSLTTGTDNTAVGFQALYNNTTASANTANGYLALFSTTTGIENTATGYYALSNNTTGSYNTANGGGALYNNITGVKNTATGYVALTSNTTGINNTANGGDSMYWNTTGKYNTANGQGSLQNNTTGSNNTADGQNALLNNTTASSNIALGSNAGLNLTTGSNNIDIGNRGVAGEAKTIRIGKQGTQTATFVAGISGATVAGGVGVIVDSAGRLGTVTSSARFKDNIKPMDKVSEAILALRPVTFRYKDELDPANIPQFGLVAEQVASVNPDLVARDDDGKPYTVRYEAVNAMLLNEFLKEHRQVEALEATVRELKSRVAWQENLQTTVAQQQKGIKILTAVLQEQASQIQRVSDQLEVSKAAPRVAADNH